MSVEAMQEYVRIAKYTMSRPLEDGSGRRRRETWGEQVKRVFDMHREFYAPVMSPKLEDIISYTQKKVLDKDILGSQRALQFGGSPILKHNAKMYNCCASYADRPRFFQECMYLLLCGCGVGFSVQKHHVAKLPPILPSKNVVRKSFVVPDSIEGWADAIGVLISSYMQGEVPFPEFQGLTVNFEFYKIRPEGAPLSSGIKAPGPKPLKRSLDHIENILRGAMGRRLRPIEVYDIVMHIADAVISGGVRRSATIAVFSPDDLEMATAKVGDWMTFNQQRGRSNNSALLVRDQTSYETFRSLMKMTAEYGEPGVLWSDSTEFMVNPCVEISLYPSLDTEGGKRLSGWQFCNLTEINGKKCRTKQDLFTAAHAAAILGTLQAGYTNFPYLGHVSEEITRREALLGVSITGMMDSPDVLFDPENQREAARIVKQANAEVASLIGINPAARTTCIKPAGSSSLLLGTSSGVHPHHARRYFRRIQANRQEAPLQFFKRFNPRAVEESVWDPNGVTELITFLCEVPPGSKTKNQVPGLELLRLVKDTQVNWVREGTRPERCVRPGLVHNVSNTIHVKDDEWDEISQYIYENREHFAGISLIPYSGDKDYPQSVWCRVPYPHEILKEYGPGSFFASGIIERALAEFASSPCPLWAACDYLFNRGANAPTEGREAWRRAAIKFANSHFHGNLKKMSYCLKDIYNLKLWEKLSQEYVDVDWSQMIEDIDSVNHQLEAACASGSCEIPQALLDTMRQAS